MKDRCLRNDDIIGSQPKSFTIKKLYLKQQQEKASIFGFPTAISSIKNSPITQYQDIGHNYSKKEEKAYLFKNNIYGFDPNSSQKEKKGYLYEKSAFLIKNDSLDLFQKDFQQKIAENHKENTQKERNYLDNVLKQLDFM